MPPPLFSVVISILVQVSQLPEAPRPLQRPLPAPPEELDMFFEEEGELALYQLCPNPPSPDSNYRITCSKHNK